MKPLRPFPLPICVGTDICQISRVFGIVVSGRGQRFVDRILTKEEQEREGERLRWVRGTKEREQERKKVEAGTKDFAFEALQKREPELWSLAAFLAGRFAAKEAAIKSHPHRHLTFHDVSVERLQPTGHGAKERLGSGPPVVRIKAEAGGEDDGSALVSISHDGDYATAVCIGYDDRR
ncbi:hypothetical protein NLU13_4778 [Sarocladium strictum]|uniref:4'-phosphopantetheinyl transferase domain-containing protein n=1 Tax=Sarocladium strictum TaxID=5046 RepID=A0AA39L954_SARSR|nr:hypothetical protein NLU13_4778 [Sarocladium strictum]